MLRVVGAAIRAIRGDRIENRGRPSGSTSARCAATVCWNESASAASERGWEGCRQCGTEGGVFDRHQQSPRHFWPLTQCNTQCKTSPRFLLRVLGFFRGVSWSPPTFRVRKRPPEISIPLRFFYSRRIVYCASNARNLNEIGEDLRSRRAGECTASPPLWSRLPDVIQYTVATAIHTPRILAIISRPTLQQVATCGALF